MRTFFFRTLAFIAFVTLFGLAALPVGLSLAEQLSYACLATLGILFFVPGRSARLLFLTVCAWVVARYLAWRFTSITFEDGMASGIVSGLLLLAECYGAVMLVLGLFVNAYPVERKPAKLPANEDDYPSVDIYIPTYSEPISVVAPTLMAALEIDYPKHRFNVYILDDGHPRSKNPKTNPEQAIELAKRSEDLQALCARHGATWLTREKNEHAKSGNMNSAMRQTKGELILVLDADHVPTRDILRNTVGFFLKDKRLAFVQTPHFFVNADPVERNLGLYNKMPGENDMFYRVVQKGLDTWNASFFCGSAAVLRRKAIDDIGGFSTESITEDASTSVKMHQRGWRSAYYGRPMVAGLQPETFAGFTVQRLRWAMGMMQIFIKQNPLIVRGLSIAQRLSYLSVVMFWLFPVARTIFFIAPLASLFFNLTIYPVGAEFFQAYTLPYLAAVLLSFQRSFGRVRRILISELYETLQSFYALPAIIATLLRPSKPTFAVTPKGEHLDTEFISELRTPFYVLYALTIAAFGWSIYRFIFEPELRGGLLLTLSWVVLNLILLSASMGVLLERVQRRSRPRIPVNMRVEVKGEFGTRQAVLLDVNESAARIRMLTDEEIGPFELHANGQVFKTKKLPSKFNTNKEFVVKLVFQNAEEERKAVLLGYGESQRWVDMWKGREASPNILWAVIHAAIVSVRAAARHLRHIAANADK